MSTVNKQLLDAAKLILEQAKANSATLNLYTLKKLTAAIAAAEQAQQAEPVAADPAVAAIQFALETHSDGLHFLRLWNEGEFDLLRREWPEAPEDIYIGADPLLEVPTQQQAVACNHRIADARNPVVSSGYVCVDCGALFSAADHSQPAMADRDAIRRVFMAHGFTIKDGQTDLKPYVYEAAEALLRELSPAVAVPDASQMRDALEMMFGSNPSHSVCHHEGADIFGRVKGTWSLAAETACRAALAAAQKGGA